MNIETPKSKQLLDKVYAHLDTIDVTKLSMAEMKDFLEVVQKGQFLEAFGTTSAIGCVGFNSPAPVVGDTADTSTESDS